MSKKDDILNSIPESILNALKKEIRDSLAKIENKTKGKGKGGSPSKPPKEIPVVRVLAFFITVEDDLDDHEREDLVDRLHPLLIGTQDNLDVDIAALSAGHVTGIAVKILSLKDNTPTVLRQLSEAVTEFDGVLSLELIDMCNGMAVRIDNLSDNDIDPKDDDDDDWWI